MKTSILSNDDLDQETEEDLVHLEAQPTKD